MNPTRAYRQRESELTAQIAQAKRARASIGDAAVAANRSLTDDERTRFVAAGKDIDTLDAQLAENAELLAAAVARDETDRNFGQVQPDPDAVAQEKANKAAGMSRIEVPDMTKKAGFFGRQLQAIHKLAVAHGNWHDIDGEDRTVLKPMQAAATGAGSDIPADGGFLVTQDRASTVMQRAYEAGQILSRVTRMPIGAGFNGVKIPAIDETSRADSSRYGGIVSGWLGQGGTLSAGKPKFREIDLKLRKVGAFMYATDELLQDAVALEGWVNRYLPLELTFRTENAIINGTGANQPQGMLNSGCLISVTRNTASRVIYDDVRAMWLRMWYGCRPNAVWFVDQTVEGDLEQLSLPIGTAGVLAPIYKPAGSQPGQGFATLYGRPVIPVEHCANLGTAGDIVLCDCSQYVVIDKGGVESAVSIHVQFLADESVFRFLYRVDGQCTWYSALTPKSAGNTLSCCVALSA